MRAWYSATLLVTLKLNLMAFEASIPSGPWRTITAPWCLDPEAPLMNNVHLGYCGPTSGKHA